MTTQAEPLSPFLKKQAEIMASRAQQDIDIAERQKPALTPAVQEADSRRTDVVETLIPQTGQSSRQVIQPTTPPAQRFVRPAPLTLEEVRDQLVNAGNTIDAARETYQHDTDSLDAFYSEANKLRAEIAELQATLREKQSRLTELESAGSPKDKYLAAVVSSEQEVAGIAGALFVTLSEQASQKVFGVPFAELSKDGQRDIQARFRKVFQRYISGFYVRIGRTAKTATVDQIAARADELLNDLSELIEQI
jgi:hypothetical protein